MTGEPARRPLGPPTRGRLGATIGSGGPAAGCDWRLMARRARGAGAARSGQETIERRLAGTEGGEEPAGRTACTDAMADKEGRRERGADARRPRPAWGPTPLSVRGGGGGSAPSPACGEPAPGGAASR